MIKCKCNLAFCTKHRSTWKHACPYDYKREGRENLRKSLATESKTFEDYNEYEQRYLLHHETRANKVLHAAAFLVVIW